MRDSAAALQAPASVQQWLGGGHARAYLSKAQLLPQIILRHTLLVTLGGCGGDARAVARVQYIQTACSTGRSREARIVRPAEWSDHLSGYGVCGERGFSVKNCEDLIPFLNAAARRDLSSRDEACADAFFGDLHRVGRIEYLWAWIRRPRDAFQELVRDGLQRLLVSKRYAAAALHTSHGT